MHCYNIWYAEFTFTQHLRSFLLKNGITNLMFTKKLVKFENILYEPVIYVSPASLGGVGGGGKQSNLMFLLRAF